MGFLDVDFVKASFALYIVIVSLIRLMSDTEFFRLTAMKRIFGRSMGLLIHFLSNVIMPLIFAIYFLCRGVVSFVPF